MMAQIGWRDLVVVIVGFGSIPVALYSPFLGLLMYAVLSFVRPAQTLTWASGVSDIRFAFLVGLVLVFRTFMSRPPWFRLRWPTPLFLAFWAWMVVCTTFSPHREVAAEFMLRFSKIGIFALLVTGLVHYRWQMKWLIVLLALCPGFYAVKLGLFFLTGQATYTHHGGPEGMDNNDIALFLSMGFPLLIFGAVEVRRRWAKWGMYSAAALTIPAVIVGQSRGGMLALAVAGIMTIWRRWGWLKAVVLIVLAAVIGIAITPQETMVRYMSLGTYEGDISAVGRLRAWQVSTEMVADHPMTGIGMGEQAFLDEYDNYKVHPDDWPHVAHSIWFSALAGMGWPGLGMFVLLLVGALWRTRRVRRIADEQLGDDGAWAVSYATGIETSIVAFVVAGTFLSQVGFEYAYGVILLCVPLHAMVQQQLEGGPIVDEADEPLDEPAGAAAPA